MNAERKVTVADRTKVISSYTIVKGAMIDETYAVMAAWDFAQSKKENLDRLRRSNFIAAKSDSWLRDIAKVLNRRFDPDGRDRALVALAKSGCELEEWKPLLLWHLTRDEFLLNDFLVHWLFSTCYDSSAYRVRHEDLHTYLLNISKRVGTEYAWNATTLQRVARGLLSVAADFGLLNGCKVREFAPYSLPERSFIYLLNIMLDKYKCPKKVIHAVEWRMFLLCPSDIERELLRLHHLRKLEYEVEGGLAQLSLPCKSAEEYAERMGDFTPGDRCEVNYASHKVEWLEPRSGQIHEAHVFIGVLSYSRLIFAWASEDEESSNWVKANRKMFDAFGGVPNVTVCACLKQGVITSHRYDPNINPGYAEISAHYMTAVIPPEATNEKSLVEDAIKIVMRTFRFINCRHTFTSIPEINYALANTVDRLNRKKYPRLKNSRLERWAEQEIHALKTLPAVAFDAIEWSLARVHPDSTVSLESSYYSVPHENRGKNVRMKLSATYVEIFVELRPVAIHKRDFSRKGIRHVFPEHLPENGKAYLEAIPQGVLSQAGIITEPLRDVIETLFAKDTLGNLRRAQGLISRSHDEIQNYGGRENAEPRIHEAIEQMRQFNNFGVRYFEATLRQLRQKSKKSTQRPYIDY